MRTLTRLLVATGVVALAGGIAQAAPAPGFTAPTDGATISRSAGSIAVTGDGGFAAPAPTRRSVYLRYSGDAGSCGSTYLSDTDGPDGGNGCSAIASPPVVPAEAEPTFAAEYTDTGEVAYPLTLDASRNIEGTIAIASVTPNAMVFDVRITLGNETITHTVDHGPYADSWFLSDAVEIPVSIDIPDSLDKVDVSSMRVEIVWKQWVNVGASTWIEHDEPASFLGLPTFSASFSRSVKVAVDDPALSNSSKAITTTLNEDGTFSGVLDLAGLTAGDHRLYVQSTQGGQKSTVRSVGFTLTE